MPITVESPVQGDAVGPGTVIRASTFSVLPVGHHWDAGVISLDANEFVISAVNGNQGQSMELILGTNVNVFSERIPLFMPQVAAPATGAEYTLNVRVISAESTIVDTSPPIGVVWRPDPWGTAYVQSLQATSTTTGGFTQADRTMLEVTHASVVSSIPLTAPIPGIAELGLDLLQAGPPIEFLGVSEDFLLTGRGSINRPSGSTGIYAYGCRWLIEAAPAGLGKLQGVIDLYEQRIVQFVLIKGGAGGFEYADQVEEDHRGSGQLSWGVPFPKRLEFSILPGVTLRFRWLLFLQAP